MKTFWNALNKLNKSEILKHLLSKQRKGKHKRLGESQQPEKCLLHISAQRLYFPQRIYYVMVYFKITSKQHSIQPS